MNNLAPIAYFTYNRPEHTKISLESLKKNELAKFSQIIVFSDGPKNNQTDKNKVKEVRNILEKLTGFKKKQLLIEK